MFCIGLATVGHQRASDPGVVHHEVMKDDKMNIEYDGYMCVFDSILKTMFTNFLLLVFRAENFPWNLWFRKSYGSLQVKLLHP